MAASPRIVHLVLFLLLTTMFRLSKTFSLITRRKGPLNLLVMSTIQANSVSTYNHLTIEPKWQKYWDDNQVFKTIRRMNKPKKYVLDMFPYPSGSGLHVGHPEGYTATDIMARYWRMNDYDVLHPMGWDAFGLPAEQHAINTGTHPAVTTYQNIATFKRQLKSLGFSYDWGRELSTTDDNYVKWTQWIFLQLFKTNLAMQSEVSVNWCPALGTVLANEEVINGLSERGNHPVIRQPLRQWILKITKYADKLESGLAAMQWPEGTLSAQKQWIGRSVGANIKFEIADYSGPEFLEVFTTRPDTIMGVTYVVLAPEHPLAKKIVAAKHMQNVEKYIQEVSSKSDLERTSTGKDRGKTGVDTGAYCIHPLTNERLPIWVADYVLYGYGTGMVMAVPAHDERDFAFATNFHLPIKRVLNSVSGPNELPMVEDGVVCSSGKEFDGLSTDDCKNRVVTLLASKGVGGEQVTYKLRDWVFSRQRYWGEPIPIYFPVEILTNDGTGSPIAGCKHRILYDQPIAVPESELPLKLPEMTDFQPGDDPQGCLARAVDWRYFQKDGKWYARETNTMPQWAGSCWYYLRFTDPQNSQQIMGKEGASWLPVDLYVGGQEHAVLHLLYARFWHKVLHDIGVVDHPEPFTKLIHQGMILGSDGEKMSKSRGNVINPDDVVKEHGADALRLYEMFMGPLEAVKPWQTSQLSGVVRFRDRVYNLITSGKVDPNLKVSGDLSKDMHKTIKKVSGDIDKLSFNTCISNLMIYSNTLNSLDRIPQEAAETLVLLLSPFAPHIAEEAWSLLGHSGSISGHPWPKYNEELCADNTVTMAIQVNGKVRGTMDISVTASESEAMGEALKQAGVTKYTNDTSIKKIVYVPGRILNIIVSK